MDDGSIVSVDDVDDPRVAERTGVVRLPSRRRIERRSIEHDRRPAVVRCALDDGGVELPQVGIGVIEPFRHALLRFTTGSAMPASLKPRARSTQLSQ